MPLQPLRIARTPFRSLRLASSKYKVAQNLVGDSKPFKYTLETIVLYQIEERDPFSLTEHSSKRHTTQMIHMAYPRKGFCLDTRNTTTDGNKGA